MPNAFGAEDLKNFTLIKATILIYCFPSPITLTMAASIAQSGSAYVSNIPNKKKSKNNFQVHIKYSIRLNPLT